MSDKEDEKKRIIPVPVKAEVVRLRMLRQNEWACEVFHKMQVAIQLQAQKQVMLAVITIPIPKFEWEPSLGLVQSIFEKDLGYTVVMTSADNMMEMSIELV